MMIVALLIFLIGIATEEYIYGIIFATLIYLFDSNRKLQTRVKLLERDNLKPQTITQKSSNDTSAVNTHKNAHVETHSANPKENLNPEQPIKFESTLPQTSTVNKPLNLKSLHDNKSASLKTVVVKKGSFTQGIINKILEPLVSTILGPFTSLLSSFTKIYTHYKKQGKAPVFFLTLAGIVTLVMGFGYLLQYSFNEYLPPLGKVSIGYLSALAVLIFAIRLHKTRHDMSEYCASLIGLSVILLYLCSYFLGPYYQLISDLKTFSLLVLICATGYILSKVYETRIVAFISLLGGALSPIFLTSIISSSPLLYLSFLLLICIGAMVIAFSIRWQLLAQISFVLSIGLVEFVLLQAHNSQSITAILLVHLFFYTMCLNLYFQWFKFKTSRQNCLIQLCISLAFMLVTLEQVSSSSQQYGLLLLFNAFLAASVFLFCQITGFKSLINKDFKIIALLISGFFTGTALLVLISTELLSLVWGIEGLILLYLGLRFNFYSVRIEAYLLLLVSSLSAILNICIWFFDAIAPMPLLVSLEFNLGYLNLVSIVALSFVMPILLNINIRVISYKEKVFKNYLNQLSFCLLSLLFMTSIACIYDKGFWLFALIPLFGLIVISHKFNWPKLEKIAFLHWLLLLIPVIASGLYMGDFHFKTQTLIGQIARIEAFIALWLIAYFYRKLFTKSTLFKIAQHLDTTFFIILPICFLPSVYRQSPEVMPLVLWGSALLSVFIYYKLQRPVLWLMAKLVILTAASASIFACYLIRFENWQGYGLSALLLGCVLLLSLLLVSKSFSHQVTSSVNIFKNKVVSVFSAVCIFWGISLLIFVFGITNSAYYGLFSTIIYCYALILLPYFNTRMKPYYGTIHRYIWLSGLCLTLGLWLYSDINQLSNLSSIAVIYIPLLFSLFFMSYTQKPRFVLTRRLGLKQKSSILMCHFCLTSIYLSLIYLYELKLTSPLISILLVIHGTNLLFHTLKTKYLWLMPISIGYFVIATSKVLLWDISGFTVLQKVIAFMFIGCILLGSAFQFQKLKTKNA